MSVVVSRSLNEIPRKIVFLLTLFINGLFVFAENCGQEGLAQCTRPLTLVSSIPVISIATKRGELDDLCRELYDGVHCIRSYTRRCMSLEQRKHFLELYKGTSQVVREICKDGPHQEKFLKHSPCLRSAKSKYESCANNYQTALNQIHLKQNSNNHTFELVCCSFKSYLDCSEEAVYETCGYEAAKFTRRFLDIMSSSMNKEYCGHSRDNNCSKNSAPIQTNAKFIVTLALFIGILVRNQIGRVFS